MKLIKSWYEILPQASGLEGVYKQIELAGRTCYKSSDKITENSYSAFYDMIKTRNHLSVTEHGTVYLMITHDPEQEGSGSYYWDECTYCWYNPEGIKYKSNHYSKIHQDKDNNYYITTNMRVLIENGWEDDLKYLCEPTEYHEKRITVRVGCSIGISREFNRHRTFSISEQSTRYCNYSLDKFGNEITCIQPSWFKHDLSDNNYCSNLQILAKTPLDGYDGEDLFIESLIGSEETYFNLLKFGLKPQHARDVLPLATATEVIYTAFVSDWKHFFSLRCSDAAHPNARAIAIPLREEFKERKLIDE